jgi:hypothetical protein
MIEYLQMLDLTDSSQSRQTFNSPSVSSTIVTKLRPDNVRLGRSQSQADLPFSSKFSSLRQQQRGVVNGSTDVLVSPSPSMVIPTANGDTIPALSKTPPSSTTTALMMINKHYVNNPSSSLPTMSNHHQNNAKKIPLYDKRHSNHT